MKNIPFWIIIGAVALFVLGLFGGMFLPFVWNNTTLGYGCANGWNGYSMMGYRGFMPMMGGWGSPFGFLGMLFMGLIPLIGLVLLVGGFFWLVSAITSRQPQQ